MTEDDNEPRKKKKTDSNADENNERPEKVSCECPTVEQPVYLDEIILETVKEKISQMNNVIPPSIEDMRKMMGALETVESIGKARNQESVNKDTDSSQDE